ncbi:UvrD-helicase domain-containing protein [Pseudactinotalea sp. Z1732]|uniref:UvrD-helicase domain-containing protein n=1 Tax=Micrococcales TaxID=85006 RepID=UPI003C7C4EF9
MTTAQVASAGAVPVTHSAARVARLLGHHPPTAEQARIIEAPLKPLLVVAGAGSGKTETMAARVVYLVANRLVPPGSVLGLTFTRKAAAELSQRIRTRLHELSEAGVGPGVSLEDQPRIATYNSYAASLLTDHALRMGLDPDARLISDAGRFQLAEQIVRAWPQDLETGYAGSTVVDAVTSLAAELAEHGLEPAETAKDLRAQAQDLLAVSGKMVKEVSDIAASLDLRARLMELVAEFGARKEREGVVDFGDQVRMAARIARAVPKVGALERTRYPVVLLDEYQDTSVAQVQLLTALFGGGHPVTAVGDPNQAIYGWRGAAAGTLLSFPEHFRVADGQPAAVTPLSTAWRNDTAILSVANRIAEPLRSGVAATMVPPLRPSPAAGRGTVLAHCAETVEEEAAQIARVLTRHWSDDPEAPATAAVLCRKRSQFPLIEEALLAAGLPCQVVGLGGLLATAEVADIRAALTVAHDPSRGDAMMRLLTGPSVQLGAADLAVLWEWAAAQTRGRPEESGQAAQPQADQVLEADERSSLVEAVDRLPRGTWTDRHGRTLSGKARERLRRLSGQIRRIRALTHLDMAELVTTTEQILGLDIEVIAHVPGSVAHARRNLDAFTTAAASFTGGTEEPGLGAFLSYLDAVEEEERGLDLMVAEPDPTAIQIMTVHASKGLEWDTVVVAGLNTGDFPTLAPNKDGHYLNPGWLTNVRALPYGLRGDHDWLPDLPIQGAGTIEEVRQARTQFCHEEGERLLDEERRLAYVAMTRARHVLILTSCFWGTRKRVSVPSPFLKPLVQDGLADPGPNWPTASAHPENPRTDADQVATWPRPAHAVATAWEQIWDGADQREQSVPTTSQAGRWWADAELLLAERDAVDPAQVTMPEHLSASAMVELARDAPQFWRHRRRPVPRRPRGSARRGTQFHAWVEQYFGARTLLDWELLPGAEEEGPDQELAALRQAFLDSDWSTRTPVAVEVDIEILIREVAVRCRIDAVFPTTDGVHVVDWKTGTPPHDDAARHATQVQLGLYRLAWARLHQVPIETVQASLHYVAQNRTVHAAELTEAELEDLLQPPT